MKYKKCEISPEMCEVLKNKTWKKQINLFKLYPYQGYIFAISHVILLKKADFIATFEVEISLNYCIILQERIVIGVENQGKQPLYFKTTTRNNLRKIFTTYIGYIGLGHKHKFENNYDKCYYFCLVNYKRIFQLYYCHSQYGWNLSWR